MAKSLRWTSYDLELLPDDGKRYEIVEGELYARRGVLEYWIVDWRVRQLKIYRREQLTLSLIGTLRENDTLKSQLQPGFRCALNDIFDDMTI